MKDAQTAKKAERGGIPNSLLNIFDRNQLANQIFDGFDYARQITRTQRFCRNCGRIISRDDVIFNKSLCRKCVLKQSASKIVAQSQPNNQIFKVPQQRIFKLVFCKICKFIYVAKSNRRVCAGCETIGIQPSNINAKGAYAAL